MSITRTDKRLCPHCGGIVDAHTPATKDDEDRGPMPGDLCICFQCGTALAFTEGLNLRFANRQELEAIDPKLIEAVKRGRKMLDAHKAKEEIKAARKEVFPVDVSDINSMVEAVKAVVTNLARTADLGPIDSIQILLTAAVLMHKEYCPVREPKDNRKVFGNVVDAVWRDVEENYEFGEAGDTTETLQ